MSSKAKIPLNKGLPLVQGFLAQGRPESRIEEISNERDLLVYNNLRWDTCECSQTSNIKGWGRGRARVVESENVDYYCRVREVLFLSQVNIKIRVVDLELV